MFCKRFVDYLAVEILTVKQVSEIAEPCYLKDKGSFNQVADSQSRTVGMEMVLAQEKQVEEDDALGIIGIYEMDDIVKTVLLSKFHNEFLADAIHLDMVIFVNSYRYLDVESIQKKIHHGLGFSWKNKSH
ncbi:hypothetical protein ZIOFF_017550 [Zingiber officinale]|uniref:Uncharacterized protein n=1 Tax=Zingiber officinale TaxID=94328 RepID=A0A8J5H549_ZINOF|nr:hypothetical protein ZIOFF_017550 [Zingiber officinale]